MGLTKDEYESRLEPLAADTTNSTKPLAYEFAHLSRIKLTSQFWLHSQCESRKVRTLASAASAPLTLDRMRPSRCRFRITRTFWILDSSSPSLAAKNDHRKHKIKSI